MSKAQSAKPEWAQALEDKQARITSAEQKVKQCRTDLYDVVIDATNDSRTTVESVAKQVGWSVSYLRAMRGRSDRSVPRTKVASADAVTKATASRIASARTALDKAEAQHAKARRDLIELIERITAPTPTMADVAGVLGISRQRVSQLLDEL